ncbi:Uncharacterised protein [uncultured Coprococcus sp.]|uniref:hypothetical protein n=1 Tax=Coprococcus ammoniilyticus TaxID=2981785 RepID=UPI0003406509|nr:hypothetical protein [Coprococcus ammoniilyticus]MCU6729940.1 hypothetical protein [Coprococcus ammoniilyticus]CCY59939.1 uncharacterized protein BN572_01214 [Clostridium sp. CAG:264]SCH12224.1 Uncharacterised protein [uncultured Coprococcus sp.]
MGRAVRAAVAGILIGLFCGTLYVEMGALKRLYSAKNSVEQVMNLVEYAEGDEDIAYDSTEENYAGITGDKTSQTDGKNGRSNQMVNGQDTLDGQDTELSNNIQTAFRILDGTTLNAYETQKQLQELEAVYDDIARDTSEKKTDGENDYNIESGKTKTELVESKISAQNKTSDVIRIRIRYEGNENLSDKQLDEFTSYVEQAVLYGIAEKLGADYNDQEKSIVRKNLILSKEYIDACAEESAEEYGIPVTAWSAFEYLNLPAATLNGVAYPAGYYETLCVTLKRL